MLVLKSVCWSRKCSQYEELGGRIKVQPFSLHFLSAKTVLLSTLSMDNAATVPLGPWSKAVSQTFSQPVELATSATVD